MVAPPGSTGITLLLAQASKADPEAYVGDPTGEGSSFLATVDFTRDDEETSGHGIRFARAPKRADYGTVAVFEDRYGKLWDSPNSPRPLPAKKVTGTSASGRRE